MDERLLREKGIDPTNGRIAAVENFQLVITERATLVPSVDQVAHGMVFSLTHEEVDKLYSDPSVNMYRPEAVSARLDDGSAVPCLCFNLPAVNASDERNLNYAEKLRTLALRLGLPASYVQSI